MNYKYLNNNEENLYNFFFNFIINKNSKILQIGDIDKNVENMISKLIQNNNFYIKMNNLNFNYNKLLNKNNFFFDLLIISYYKKTYEFCINFSGIFKQTKYIFFYYNDKTKLCNAVRSPFYKQNFKPLINYPYFNNELNIGALVKNNNIKFEIFKKGDLKGEIGIFNLSYGSDYINRSSIINHLIYKYNFYNYLEIGVNDGLNFNKINIKNKIGIEPYPSKDCIKNILFMTSDEYFEFISNSNLKFDIIFIDGINQEYQMNKDINNSLKFLNDNGFIILKNCNPPNKTHQQINIFNNGISTFSNGTSWRSFVNLRINNPNLHMSVINCEWGLGIIQKGKQKCYNLKEKLNYKHLDIDRDNILNLISVYEFLIKY